MNSECRDFFDGSGIATSSPNVFLRREHDSEYSLEGEIFRVIWDS